MFPAIAFKDFSFRDEYFQFEMIASGRTFIYILLSRMFLSIKSNYDRGVQNLL